MELLLKQVNQSLADFTDAYVDPCAAGALVYLLFRRDNTGVLGSEELKYGIQEPKIYPQVHLLNQHFKIPAEQKWSMFCSFSESKRWKEIVWGGNILDAKNIWMSSCSGDDADISEWFGLLNKIKIYIFFLNKLYCINPRLVRHK